MTFEDRKRIRCKKCKLVQFVRDLKTCLKCREAYGEVPPPQFEPQPEPVEVKPLPVGSVSDLGILRDFDFWNSVAIVYYRTKSGFSQKELAKLLDAPRTYVSKIENEAHTPRMETIKKLASAFSITPEAYLNTVHFLHTGQLPA